MERSANLAARAASGTIPRTSSALSASSNRNSHTFQGERMKSLLYVLFIVTLTFALAGCAQYTTQQASATTSQPADSTAATPAAATAPAASAKAVESKPAARPADAPEKPAPPRTF